MLHYSVLSQKIGFKTMNYLINTSKFKGRLLAIILSCFMVGIVTTFSQNAFAEEVCWEGKVCVAWDIKCRLGHLCGKVCVEWKIIKHCKKPPSLADFISFNAIPSSDSIVSLKWETSSEHDNAGFNIWRVQLENDDVTHITKVNKQIIPSKSILEWTGTSYSVEDATVANGNTYYYVLEDINNAGENTLQCDYISAVSIGKPLQDTEAVEKVKQICEEYAEEPSE